MSVTGETGEAHHHHGAPVVPDGLGYGPDYGQQPGARVPQQDHGANHEVQPLLPGAPAGRLGRLAGEVEDGASEEDDGRDGEDDEVGVDAVPHLLPVLTAHVLTGVQTAGVLHYQAGQQEAEAGPHVVEHLADGGGRHSLVRREPSARHGGRGGGDHDAGDPVEDGAQVTEEGELTVGDGRKYEEHAAD